MAAGTATQVKELHDNLQLALAQPDRGASLETPAIIEQGQNGFVQLTPKFVSVTDGAIDAASVAKPRFCTQTSTLTFPMLKVAYMRVRAWETLYLQGSAVKPFTWSYSRLAEA